MAIALNHTIVRVRDKHRSADWYADILGTPKAKPYGPFLVLELDNGASLDFADDHGSQPPTHYAFLVGEDDFARILARIQERQLTYWADPSHRRVSAINHNDGGRGVYWDDPDGNNLEIITRPYGGAS